MNTYNFDDSIFRQSQLYQDFIRENPSQGFLRIRAYAASGALPISGLRVIVFKNVENSKIIFFDGVTNNSGVIEKIILPTPKIDDDNQVIPKNITYDVEAIYEPDNIDRMYRVNMYENVYAVQNINIVPSINNGVGDY